MSCKCGVDRMYGIDAKCSDLCTTEYPDGKEKNGYVPRDLGIGGGDYVSFNFCGNCGQIEGVFPIVEEDEDD